MARAENIYILLDFSGRVVFPFTVKREALNYCSENKCSNDRFSLWRHKDGGCCIAKPGSVRICVKTGIEMDKLEDQQPLPKIALARDVISKWNEIAEEREWKKSRALSVDLNKVKAALNRPEWRNGIKDLDGSDWSGRLDFMMSNGFDWVGQPGPHSGWRPNLKWFTSDRATATIIKEMDDYNESHGQKRHEGPMECPKCGKPGFVGELCIGCDTLIG